MHRLVWVYAGPICHKVIFYLASNAQAGLGLRFLDGDVQASLGLRWLHKNTCRDNLLLMIRLV